MTNNWTDMGNASLFVVMGANPVENHPASLAHINKARDKGAKLIVIDPRKTRTALQADRYVRHRPGTDIAFIMGVVRYVIADMESRGDALSTKFYEFLNQSGPINAWSDGDASGNAAAMRTVPRCSKYTDARFILKADGSDYDRVTHSQITGLPDTSGNPNTQISNFPQKANSVFDSPNTVYNRLKAHVDPYTTAVVADICGCTEEDLIYVANAYIDNCRAASIVSVGGGDASGNDPRNAGYKATTMLYAMGLTQHTVGSQNVKSFTVLQILLGNMGRAGGGINALRGIHNVQGSTDMGLLQHLIPGYSGNPSTGQTFGQYMDAIFGHPLSGSANRTVMDGSYDDAYSQPFNGTTHYLQQIGFANMNLKFFGEPDGSGNMARSEIEAIFSLWPRVNGSDHITMFRHMYQDASGNDVSGNDASRVTKACVAWGQNPAVTEPNQEAVRRGLESVDLLVVVDMFENETAAVTRKATGTTYLIPACSHVEEAGSVTNSGRCLQWREEARGPAGNSKTDIELLLRLAKALDDNGGFSHIQAVWDTSGNVTAGSVFEHLYADQYGWDASGTAFDDVSLTGVDIWHGANAAPTGTFGTNTVYGSEAVAELCYRQMCLPRGFVRHSDYTAGTAAAASGAMWIYDGAFSNTLTTNKHTGQADWLVRNRSKSRDNADNGGILAYPGWGFAWIFNRRVFYNNGDNPTDVTDFFMGPDSCARIFVSTNTNVINYSRWYRKINQLGDLPDTCLSGYTAPHVLTGRFPGHMEPYETPRADLAATWGRNTMKRADYPAGTPGVRDQWSCVHDDSPVAGRDVAASGFPLVLTTMRCVEHFQGGPITRNNPWNVEAEPEPWVEINSLDAAAYGIKDGDLVQITTARGNSTNDQEDRRKADAAGFAQGFRARVGVGLQSNQRVGQGVVAIPWHWGDRGLSTGSCANDLTLDAGDANTTIPEYKACLCKIEPVT